MFTNEVCLFLHIELNQDRIFHSEEWRTSLICFRIYEYFDFIFINTENTFPINTWYTATEVCLCSFQKVLQILP